MVDFFNKDFYNNGEATGLGKIYEYRFSATAENGKIPKVRKTEIEELAVNLNKMFRFVVFLLRDLPLNLRSITVRRKRNRRKYLANQKINAIKCGKVF